MSCKSFLFSVLFCCTPLFVLCQVTSTITIIPQPATAYGREGEFELKSDTRIYFPEGKKDWETAIQYFMAVAQTSTGYQLVAQPFKGALPSPADNGIYFMPDEVNIAQDEGYKLDVKPASIVVTARTAAGAFYAAQSLRQLFPPQFNSPKPVSDVAWKTPCCLITDQPRFNYRGMHLDVGRHFFPVTFVKRYIDLLAQHKFNRFHWHLTEDQGWRIEIKKYPKLQTVAACRKETVVGHANDFPVQYDGKEYCGYYTQEEIKEVVEYARKRFVTIVPEIEMPGHAQAALAAYPELGCTGGPYQTATTFGVFKDVFCAGNDKTFQFLEDVLAEVCPLFPGQYVHIGGDECPKDRWKACPKCQQRMKTENLKDEHELQSYFIRRAEKMLAKHGKRLIGWDEILEGGLAPTATVMSWRGVEGGIAAAKAGHYAIMTPTSHCYFDYYQGEPSGEPLAIGGFLGLDKVYNYEPVPTELNEEEARRILGAQGNVWTEYMKTPESVEYMAFPRAFALSEVLWTPKNKKNWDDFLRRLKAHFDRLNTQGVNYSRSYFDIRSSFSGGYVLLSCPDRTMQIKYSTDGTEPRVDGRTYFSPISLKSTTTVKAMPVKDSKAMGKTLNVTYYVHKALGKTYTMTKQPDQYSGGERYALTNGIAGGPRSWNNWIGLLNADMDPVIDLGETTSFGRVTTHFLNNKSSRIYPPRSIEILVSDDGVNFTSLAKKTYDAENLNNTGTETAEFNTPRSSGRYLKVLAQAFRPADGKDTWLFIDEIIVE